jgi:xylulokinase
VQQAASRLLGLPAFVPTPGEYVADGAARQAAAVLAGGFPDWPLSGVEIPPVTSDGGILARYRRHAAAYLA